MGGGRIVQMVNGNQDDIAHGMLHTSPKASEFDTDNFSHLSLAAAGNLDLESDIYLYNFNGKSGKFILNEDGFVVLQGEAGLKIEYADSGTPPYFLARIKQWIITDENGNKYYFGQNKAKDITYRSSLESKSVNYTGTSSESRTSSNTWYLTEVFDINEKNSLKFTYQTNGISLTTSGGSSIQVLTFPEYDGHHFFPNTFSCTTYTIGHEYTISRIDGNSGYAIIDATGDRTDGGHLKVNNVKLYDNLSNLMKNYHFNYSYFNRSSSDSQLRRLKLNSFSEISNNGIDSLNYKFDYEDNINLPVRYSNSVDYWGYYNGNANASSIPNIWCKYNYYGQSGLLRTTNLADRSSSFFKAQANVLRKITYPTGGTREFIYEGNTALENTNNQRLIRDKDYIFRSFLRTESDWLEPGESEFKHDFIINSTDGSALFDYLITYDHSDGFNVRILKLIAPGGSYWEEVYSSGLNYGAVELLNGDYRIEIVSTNTAFSYLYASWSECVLSTDVISTPYGNYNRNNNDVGGLRIKEIRDFDPVSSKINSTQYQYKLYSTDSTLTSGLLISPVNVISIENSGSINGKYMALNASSCYPLASYNGSYVVYPEVRVTENGNGWTDLKFSFLADVPPSPGIFPVPPAADNSVFRGNLLEKLTYSQEGVLLKELKNTYFSYESSVPAARVKPYYAGEYLGSDSDRPGFMSGGPIHADKSVFFYTVGGSVPETSIEKIYSPSGWVTKQTISSYQLVNGSPVLESTKNYVNSNSIKETKYNYPFTNNSHFTFGLSTSDQAMKLLLLGKNYVQPIEVVNTLTNSSSPPVVLGGTKRIFSTFNSSDLYLAQTRDYSDLHNYVENNLALYDSKGNLREGFRTGAVKEVYLWGHDSLYPLAKVVGSDFATISAFVNNEVLQSLYTSDVDMRAELNKIRTGLLASNVQIMTYTHKPLVGITSQTDAKGMTTYYEYDSFQRLKHIKDQEGNIIKSYDYHYKP